MSIRIREAQPRDHAAVRRVNESAFGSRAEADLVDSLRAAGAAVTELVADLDGDLVGHILFSEVTVEPPAGKRLAGLAPMSVLPRMQRHGIGAVLIREGLRRCAAAAYDGVVVLGHPKYYPRFGFAPAARFGLRCEFGAPADAFMALALPGHSLRGISGVVRYNGIFALV